MRRFIVLLSLAVLCVAGCRGNQRSTGVGLLIEPDDAHRLGYKIDWPADLAVPERNHISHAVWLDDMIVTVESPVNFVVALSAATGEELWRVQMPSTAERFFEPVLHNGSLWINSETSIFQIDTKTKGRILTIAPLKAAVVDRAAMIGNFAVFAGVNARVFGHDLKTGNARWQFEMPQAMIVRPVAVGDGVIVADMKGNYSLIDTDLRLTKRLRWGNQAYGTISVPPVVSSLGVFLVSDDQKLYCLDRFTGRKRWDFRTVKPVRKQPKIFGPTVYLRAPGEGLIAIDARKGDELWRRPDVDATPVLVKDDVLLLQGPRSMFLLETQTGKTQVQVPILETETVLTGAGGVLILVTRKGRLLRLDPER